MDKPSISSAPLSPRTAPPPPVTTLAGIVSDQPWLDSMALGMGVDAASGTYMVSGVEPFELTGFPANTIVSQYTYIETDEDMKQLVSAEIGGSYNTGDFSVKGSASFLDDVSYSDQSFTILATYESYTSGYAQEPQYELTGQALQVAKSNPAGFRNTYGDYFVANQKQRIRFTAVMTCSASSSESLIDFKASVEAEGEEVFTAEGATEFKQTASSKSVSVNITITMEGVKSDAVPPDFGSSIDAIPQALDWFKENSAPMPSKAMLVHYGQVFNPGTGEQPLPMTLPIDPDNFVQIQTLQYELLQLNAKLTGLPGAYQEYIYQNGQTLASALNELDNVITDKRSQLPTDPTDLQTYIATARSLAGVIANYWQIYNFYKSLAPMGAKQEPATGNGSGNTSTYGVSGTSIPGINILSDVTNVAYEHSVGNWTATLQWPFGDHDQNQVVIGWSIINNWNDWTDGNWYMGNHLIGNSSGSVNVRGLYDRGIDWSLKVWYVALSDFPWLGSKISHSRRRRRGVAKPGVWHA
jgi:hypothetical protein